MKTISLASVAGAVTQATGGTTFVDGMRSFDEIFDTEGSPGIRISLYKVGVAFGAAQCVEYWRQLTIAVGRPNMARPNVNDSTCTVRARVRIRPTVYQHR